VLSWPSLSSPIPFVVLTHSNEKYLLLGKQPYAHIFFNIKGFSQEVGRDPLFCPQAFALTQQSVLTRGIKPFGI